MEKKAALFSLIKSLTKAEKRYFKLVANTTGKDANHIRLFDFIDAQEEFDEDEIKAHFKGQRFINQLHVTKIYLTELILRSLRNYNTGNSIYSDILDLLRDIETLFNKELYNLCEAKINKAEQLCTRYEKHALQQEVIAWKRRLMLQSQQSNESLITSILDNEKNAIKKQADDNYYWEKTLAGFSSIANKDFLKKLDTNRLTTSRAKTLYHHLRYIHFYTQGWTDKAYKEISLLIEFLQQDEYKIKDDPSPLVTAISNKLSLLIGQKRWDETYKLVWLMREVPKRYNLSGKTRYTVRLWLRLYNLELEIYRDTKQFDKAAALITEAATYLKEHKTVIPDDYWMMLHYQFASTCFLWGDLANALHNVNAIINSNIEARADLQCYTRILNLMIHFELNNIIVLRYAVDSSKRFFAKNKKNIPLQNELLKMFSALAKGDKEQYPVIFKKALSAFSKDIANKSMYDYIDINGWVDSKLNRKEERK